MEINAQMVKELREKTSAGVMDCKEALKMNAGNLEKAIEYLRKKGINAASSKFNRQTLSGKVESYIHLYGKLGVLVEVNCETDFVANTEEFKEFIKNIAMQIAASNPRYITRKDIPKSIIEKEKDIFYAQVEKSGKPAPIIEKIVEGKLEKYFQENCLMEQIFIRDNNKNIEELLLELIAKLGENILIRRFARFKLGEEI
ncbi:MAG: translation elongation factor Ts [Candidatus Infernicultor aquiphilus]|uniref:Elongation factor Ts n=1 Tax=Candidatus Infernicultor aquiphilus TaxID=1805029 RepID=A0A1J5GWE9_9BACT|nr:translation elongation factor Ts [bacterium]OIP71280.1 MAG: translation elongation factor Ts [Candidatus Atribacteria bacterium CG2_30_33_13]PIU24896.1 MAG: translation elongation factor Ts [Candidatus Atribacteria bacterium CG08_land_8_20_14_0_20_33_29]PIW12211.1 MAG: translation elongation factor Ts [Candidatus Atribacteria bacterium CG17_big_fil_post_rev_8_21_14_2_50_34_11]PIX33792.1 MAG: translation elongation factor Ts [Candidatus Atribacteria bacterium CG_4_8_14_3_um_filter_34_18]PIY3